MWADDRSQAVHRRYQGAWVVEAAGGPEEAAWAQSWSHASSCQEAFLLEVAFVRLDCVCVPEANRSTRSSSSSLSVL